MKTLTRHTLPLQKLQMFGEAVRQQSITKAANELCVSQPAVSTGIKQLEQFFGMKLLTVVRKKIHLTMAGRVLYENWLSIAVSSENLHFAMKSVHAGATGEMRIVMVSSAKYFIPQVINKFLKSYPQVRFRCDIKRRDIVIDAIENSKYDVAILTNPPHSQFFSQHFLYDNRLVFIAHPNHPLVNKANLSLLDLENTPFIIRESSALISQMLFDIFSKNNLSLNILFEMDSTEAVKQSVISDLGVALVPEFCVKTEIAYGILKILDVENILLKNQWFLICGKQTENLSVFKNFLKLCKQ